MTDLILSDRKTDALTVIRQNSANNNSIIFKDDIAKVPDVVNLYTKRIRHQTKDILSGGVIGGVSTALVCSSLTTVLATIDVSAAAVTPTAALVGFVLGSYPVAWMLNKRKKRIRAIYVPRVAAWLKESYDAELYPDALNYITDIIVRSRIKYGFFFYSIDGRRFELMWNTDGHEWFLLPRISEEVARMKNIDQQKNGIMKNFDKNGEIMNDSTKNITDNGSVEETQTLISVRKKIATLKIFTLSPEDEYFLNRDEDELKEAIMLAQQLQTLEDDTYLSVREESLTIINDHLDILLEHQRKNVRSQFKKQRSRLENPETPAVKAYRKNMADKLVRSFG